MILFSKYASNTQSENRGFFVNVPVLSKHHPTIRDVSNQCHAVNQYPVPSRIFLGLVIPQQRGGTLRGGKVAMEESHGDKKGMKCAYSWY